MGDAPLDRERISGLGVGNSFRVLNRTVRGELTVHPFGRLDVPLIGPGEDLNAAGCVKILIVIRVGTGESELNREGLVHRGCAEHERVESESRSGDLRSAHFGLSGIVNHWNTAAALTVVVVKELHVDSGTVSQVSVAKGDLKELAYLDGGRAVDDSEAHGCVGVWTCVGWWCRVGVGG